MKRYRLKKDLPTFNPGQRFYINDCGDLVLDVPHNNDSQTEYGMTAYCARALEKFPSILTDWFEEIPEEPKTVDDLKKGDICWVERAARFMGCTTPVMAEQEVWEGDDYQSSLREIGGIFLTKEECERAIARDKAKVILERDTKGFKPDWRSGCYDKYEVVYEYSDDEYPGYGLYANDCNHCSSHSDLWFATEEDAEASINAHPNEWKTYLGVEE